MAYIKKKSFFNYNLKKDRKVRVVDIEKENCDMIKSRSNLKDVALKISQAQCLKENVAQNTTGSSFYQKIYQQCNYKNLKVSTESQLNEFNKSNSSLVNIDQSERKTLESKTSLKPVKNRDTQILYKCIYCNFKTIKKFDLTNHIKTHAKGNVYKCMYCNYESHAVSCVKKHLKSHDRSKSFKCLHCEYVTHRKDCLKNHLQIHFKAKVTNLNVSSVGLPKYRIQCLHCDFSSNWKSNIYRHNKIFHPDVKKLKFA